jgi:hypothetical protein
MIVRWRENCSSSRRSQFRFINLHAKSVSRIIRKKGKKKPLTMAQDTPVPSSLGHRRKQDERMQFSVPTGVDAAPRLGQDPQWDNWSLLWERLGEEVEVCVVMCFYTRTDTICSSTDRYGSVAPVDVCRMSPSIAALGQRLHGNTLQYWHRDSASGSVGADVGCWQDCVRCGLGSLTLPTVLAMVARGLKMLLQRT